MGDIYYELGFEVFDKPDTLNIFRKFIFIELKSIY